MGTVADRALGRTLTNLATLAHPRLQSLLAMAAITSHVFGG